MAPTLLYSKQKTDKTLWSYPKIPKTAGAFRAIAVAPLLVTSPKTPQIDLYEWPNITWEKTKRDKLMQNIKYAALSHVWQPNDEAPKPIPPSESLCVVINDAPFKEISWKGLIQAAHAAKWTGAPYFWLDFLCMDQPDHKDMELQIALMASIYKNASWVIMMIAGIYSVEKVDYKSAWIDRAWTLQEAVINYQGGKKTYIYVQWDISYPHTFKDSGGRAFTFHQVKGNDCLIKFQDMLDLPDIDLKEATKLPNPPKVTILDSRIKGRGNVPRRALQAAAFAKNPKGQNAAMWRSMYLRQSSKPADVVYSLMGCLGLKIDPLRNCRSPEFLFNDLARKAAVSPFGPAWLTIFGVTGTVWKSRNEVSYLIPKFPNTLPDSPSYFSVEGKRIDVAKYIDTSGNYIAKYDIKFVTQSYPHIISAKMPKILKFEPLNPVHGQNRASMSFGKTSGICFYRGQLGPRIVNTENIVAVYVGDVGDMHIPGKPAAKHSGNKYFLFLEWEDGWSVIGDGTFRKKGGPKWNPSKHRWLFTVGKGSQTNERRWLQDSLRVKLTKWLKMGRSVDPGDLRKSKFVYHNYGFMLLKDVNSPKAVNDDNTPIKWLGRQKTAPKKSVFKPYTFKIHTSGTSGVESFIDQFKPESIRFVACNTKGASPPRDIQTAKRKGFDLKKSEPIEYQYVHYGLKIPVHGETGRELVSGIKIPKLAKNSVITVKYYVKIQFGKKVIFFSMKQERDTDPQYHQVYIRCYGQHGGTSLTRTKGGGRESY